MKNAYSRTWFEVFLEPISLSQTESEIAFVSRQLPNPPYRKVLDICCGQGRHASLLAEMGYEVTGVDLNIEALDRARSKSDGRVAYVQMDMRNLEDLPGTFDAALILWQSFGYFDDITNADVLRQIGQKLNPNGRLILDIYHRGFFEQHQGERNIERNGLSITENRQMNGNRLTVKPGYGGRYPSDTFEWQLFTPEEIRELAGELGFRHSLTCSDFDEGKPASADNPRMQLVFEYTSRLT